MFSHLAPGEFARSKIGARGLNQRLKSLIVRLTLAALRWDVAEPHEHRGDHSRRSMYIARAKGQRLKAALEGIGTDAATLGQRWTTRGVTTALGLPHRRLSRGGGPSVPHYTESPIVARRLVKRTEVGTRDQLARERWRVDAAIRERDAERSATLTTAALHRRLLASPIEAAGGPLVCCMLAQRGAAQNGLWITTLFHSQALLLTYKRPQRASRVTEPGEPRAG